MKECARLENLILEYKGSIKPNVGHKTIFFYGVYTLLGFSFLWALVNCVAKPLKYVKFK